MSTYSKRIRFLIGNGIFVHQSSLDRCVMPVVMLTLRVRSSVTVKDKTKVFNLTFLINLNIPFGITRSQFLKRNTQHGKKWYLRGCASREGHLIGIGPPRAETGQFRVSTRDRIVGCILGVNGESVRSTCSARSAKMCRNPIRGCLGWLPI